MLVNILFAWGWMVMGLLTGTIQGIWFHREDFMGGYSSWPRRLTRLGHIAFFGTGMLNLFFAFTVMLLEMEGVLLLWASPLLIIGAVSMSAVCYLSAWWQPFRHLFFIPVLTLTGGVVVFTIALLGSVSL